MLQKNDFITNLSKRGYTKGDAAIIVEDFLATLEDALSDGESVMFRGFGTFDVRRRAGRTGTSPIDNAKIEIPASKYVHFTAGKLLRNKVRESSVE